MNFSSILGLVLAVVVFGAAALTSAKDSSVFLDAHAMLIVIGGTLAATLLSFSLKNMFNMVKVFFNRILTSSLVRYEQVIREIVDLAEGYRKDEKYLEQKVGSLKSPFLREAIQLTIEGGIEARDLDIILLKRAQTHHERYEQEAHMFHTMAKFPPAFGLLGAVLGMISLMQGLGGADAIKTVGPAMAISLVATLYGIAIANFIFVPLGENLSKFNKTDAVERKMILDGVKLIRAKKHPLVVEENVKSYLLPGERAKIKKVA